MPLQNPPGNDTFPLRLLPLQLQGYLVRHQHVKREYFRNRRIAWIS